MEQAPGIHLLLVGHSHIQCVVAAHAARPESGVRLDAIHLYRDKRSGHEADFPAYIDAQLAAMGLQPVPEVDLVGLFMGGNTHNTLGLVKTDPPFDFVLPESPDLPLMPDATLVPARAVLELLATRMEAVLRGIDHFAQRFGERAVCVESPPPLGDDEYVRQYLDAHFHDAFAAGRDVVSAAMRYKLWRLACAVFRDRCERRGVSYMSTPVEALEDGRFLRREAYPRNVTHGNAWYGGLLLDELVQRSMARSPGRTGLVGG
jgi:hypothetical protein